MLEAGLRGRLRWPSEGLRVTARGPKRCFPPLSDSFAGTVEGHMGDSAARVFLSARALSWRRGRPRTIVELSMGPAGRVRRQRQHFAGNRAGSDELAFGKL